MAGPSTESDQLRLPPVATDAAAAPVGTSRFTINRALRAGAIAAVAQYVATLAAFPFIVRHVGAEVYGLWAAIVSLMFIGSLADAGVKTEVARRVSAALGAGDWDLMRRSLRTGLGVLSITGTLIAVVGVLAAPLIRGFTFPGGVSGVPVSEIDTVVRLTMLLIGASLVIEGYLAALRGLQRTDIENLSFGAGLLLGMGATVGLAVAGLGLWAMFLGVLIQLVIRWSLQWVALRRLAPSLAFAAGWPGRQAAMSFLGLSGLLLLTQLSFVVDSQWDKVVLAHFVGAASVTYFTVGTMLVLGAQQVALMPITPILASVSEFRDRDTASLERTYRQLTRVGSATLTLVLTVAFVLGPAFINLWLGPTFAPAGTAIRLFAVASALNLMGAGITMRAVGLGRHRTVAIASACNIVVNGGVSFGLAATVGFTGPLVGSIVGNAAGLVVLCALLRRQTHERWMLPRFGGPVYGAIVALLSIVISIDHQSTWFALIACAAALIVVTGAGAVGIERAPLRRVMAGAGAATR